MGALDESRRQFLVRSAWGLTAMQLGTRRALGEEGPPETMPAYTGPNVIIIRFGGGVRRRECIDPQHTYSPFFLHELCQRGTLFSRMTISQFDNVSTSHGEGTLHILTGKYNAFKNVSKAPLGARFEPEVPTLFEYLRRKYQVAAHEAVIINGEDRTDEEFYTFSNHHLFGVHYRSTVLSLYRYKVYLLEQELGRSDLSDSKRAAAEQAFAKLKQIDHRLEGIEADTPEIRAFWEDWRQFYGDTGFVNPRGDRLLTELAARAIKQLRPKLLMINYNDPDYVHWGNASHYTRGIAVIDDGIRRLTETIDADEAYRDNTVIVVAPDCGRDNNRLMEVPFQHHFNTPAAYEIFALLLGPGIAAGQVVDKPVDQAQIAATIGRVMNVDTAHSEGPPLDDAFV